MLRHARTPSGKASHPLLLIVILALVFPTGRSQASTQSALGQRLVHEYEKQAGIESTPELERISCYISRVGNRVASALPSHDQFHFIFDPNPAFKSAFALPGGYIIVGGGLLALIRTEDELANALAHEIEHVELGNVRSRVKDLTKRQGMKNLHVNEFFPGYGKEEELKCDLKGQRLAAKAGYSPAGMLTLLETFKALEHKAAEKPSEMRPTLSERIAQASRLARASKRKQVPLKLP